MISFSIIVCVCLYKKAVDLCKLILYSATLMKFLIISRTLKVESLWSLMYATAIDIVWLLPFLFVSFNFILLSYCSRYCFKHNIEKEWVLWIVLYHSWLQWNCKTIHNTHLIPLICKFIIKMSVFVAATLLFMFGIVVCVLGGTFCFSNFGFSLQTFFHSLLAVLIHFCGQKYCFLFVWLFSLLLFVLFCLVFSRLSLLVKYF